MTDGAPQNTRDDVKPWLRRRTRVRLRSFTGTAHDAAKLARPISVAHLTDLHVGRVTPMAVLHAAVDLVNAQQPDVVAITGDFIAHSLDYLGPLTALIARIEAPVYCTLGNHDHWSGGAAVQAALEAAGACVLNNAWTSIDVHGETLQIVGLDDAYTGHDDLAAATKGLDARRVSLGLSHIAECAEGLWAHDVSLVLAGHTHAGQITWARLHEWALGKLVGHRYVHGLYGSDDALTHAVYVGAGIGASVMPLRLGERGAREAAVFSVGAPPAPDMQALPLSKAHPGRAPSAEKTEKRRLAAYAKAARRQAKQRR